MKIGHRTIYFVVLFVAILTLLYGFYLQYFAGLEPCLLCLLQRFFLILFIIAVLFAGLFCQKNLPKNIFNSFALLFSLLGLAAAGRQVWLQHQPLSEHNLTCLPNAEFLFKHFPIHEVLRMTITGTADCAVIHWQFIGLSLAEWSLIFFVIMTVITLFQYRRVKRNR